MTTPSNGVAAIQWCGITTPSNGNMTTPSNGVAGFEIGMPRAALTRGVFPAGASLQVWHGLP